MASNDNARHRREELPPVEGSSRPPSLKGNSILQSRKTTTTRLGRPASQDVTDNHESVFTARRSEKVTKKFRFDQSRANVAKVALAPLDTPTRAPISRKASLKAQSRGSKTPEPSTNRPTLTAGPRRQLFYDQFTTFNTHNRWNGEGGDAIPMVVPDKITVERPEAANQRSIDGMQPLEIDVLIHLVQEYTPPDVDNKQWHEEFRRAFVNRLRELNDLHITNYLLDKQAGSYDNQKRVIGTELTEVRSSQDSTRRDIATLTDTFKNAERNYRQVDAIAQELKSLGDPEANAAATNHIVGAEQAVANATKIYHPTRGLKRTLQQVNEHLKQL